MRDPTRDGEAPETDNIRVILPPGLKARGRSSIADGGLPGKNFVIEGCSHWSQGVVVLLVSSFGTPTGIPRTRGLG